MEEEQIDRHYREIFGKRLQFLRKVSGMSQELFADKMQIDSGQSFISKVERGDRLMSVENIYRAADVLQVHPAILMSNEQFADQQLEMLINLMKLFKSGNEKHLHTIKDLLETYTS